MHSVFKCVLENRHLWANTKVGKESGSYFGTPDDSLGQGFLHSIKEN